VTPARTVGRDRGRRVPNPALPGLATLAPLCLALVALLAACGPSVPSAPPTASTSPAASAPSGSGSPDGSNAAKPTPWPGNTVLGIEALGIADSQINAATGDLTKGVATEDLALMRHAADGLAGLDVLLPNMTKIRLNPAMVSFADRYEAAIKQIDDAATRLRTAIDGGDAPGITSATEDVLNGLKAYTAVQPELAAWIEQMPEQKRLLSQ
jgi:hypothetical protein